MGSFMLRSFENQSEVITIAKWETREAWEEFWGRSSDPKQMEGMRMLGRRVSADGV